jgi:hypothetical protein
MKGIILVVAVLNAYEIFVNAQIVPDAQFAVVSELLAGC